MRLGLRKHKIKTLATAATLSQNVTKQPANTSVLFFNKRRSLHPLNQRIRRVIVDRLKVFRFHRVGNNAWLAV
jgi:hypothetical protein